MREWVRRGAVNGDIRSDADSGNHVSDLAHDVIRENTADIVFQESKDDAVERHDSSRYHQNFPASKPAGQNIDGGFCREGAQENAPGDRSFWVRISQPGMQLRNRSIHRKA